MHYFPAGSAIELRRLIQLAWPMLLAQSAQTAMSLSDTLMASWAGADQLAAIALGSSIWTPLSLSLAGLMMALTPIVAHHVGGAREDETPIELYNNMWIALFIGVISWFFINGASEPILTWLSVEPHLKTISIEYLFAISWGIPGMLLYQSLRAFAEGHGQTRVVMKIGISAVVVNIPLNYILIFGHFGLPKMGGVGCGWATTISFWYMFFAGVAYLKYSRYFAPLKISSQTLKPNKAKLGHQLAIGIPIAASLGIETTMFCFIALFLADYGATIISGHQITLSISSLIFMLPLSLCLAVTIRVGQLNGAHRFKEARAVSFLGLRIALIIASFSCAALYLLSDSIASLYTDDLELIAVISTLLSFAALYQFSDALQLTANGALRGYKDTRIPLLYAFISYWLVGLPSGYFIAEHWALGATGYWLGILIGLSLAAVLMIRRLKVLSQHAMDNHTLSF